MSIKKRFIPPIENKFLLSLPKREQEKLLPDLELIELPLNKTLFEAGEIVKNAYLINTGMVSLIAESLEGGSVEVGVIGNEGILSMQLVMGTERMAYRAMVQIPGQALKISQIALKRHAWEHGIFCNQLLRYWQVLHNQITQSVVCSRFHTFEQRLCRWLLMTADRVNRNDFPVTHEFLSLMLGANRATVTVAFGSFKEAGLISHRRGLITILDRKRVEDVACECYRANKRELDNLSKFQKPQRSRAPRATL
jgi:CRP-like cAMP-binding protein